MLKNKDLLSEIWMKMVPKKLKVEKMERYI